MRVFAAIIASVLVLFTFGGCERNFVWKNSIHKSISVNLYSLESSDDDGYIIYEKRYKGEYIHTMIDNTITEERHTYDLSKVTVYDTEGNILNNVKPNVLWSYYYYDGFVYISDCGIPSPLFICDINIYVFDLSQPNKLVRIAFFDESSTNNYHYFFSNGVYWYVSHYCLLFPLIKNALCTYGSFIPTGGEDKMFLNVENSKFTIVFEQESESKTAIIYTIPPELRVDGSIFTCGKVLDDGCFYFTYRTYYYPHKDYLYECYDKKCVCNVRYSEIVKYDPLTGKFESVFRPEEKSFVVDIEKDCCYVFKENYIYRYDYLTQQYSPTQLFDYGKWVDEREYVAVDKAVGDFKPLPDSYVHDRDVYLARKISGDRFMVRYLNSYNVY